MKLIFLCALALHILKPSLLLNKMTETALVFQHLCSSSVEKWDKQSETRVAILCGKKITNLRTLKNFKESALIHLFIVSGSHLAFLIQLLERLKLPRWGLRTFCILFSLFTGFQPPIVRSTVQFFIHSSHLKKNYFLKPDQTCFLSGIVCLFLFPDWIDSLSFYLSWIAALCLTIPFSFSLTWVSQIFFQQIFLTVFLFPFLARLDIWSTVGWVYNIILTPILGPLLIPLALTPAWTPFIDALNFIIENTLPNLWILEPQLNFTFLMTFTLLIQFAIHNWRIYFWRSQCIN